MQVSPNLEQHICQFGHKPVIMLPFSRYSFRDMKCSLTSFHF
jgi:hypothetical protein